MAAAPDLARDYHIDVVLPKERIEQVDEVMRHSTTVGSKIRRDSSVEKVRDVVPVPDPNERLLLLRQTIVEISPLHPVSFIDQVLVDEEVTFTPYMPGRRDQWKYRVPHCPNPFPNPFFRVCAMTATFAGAISSSAQSMTAGY